MSRCGWPRLPALDDGQPMEVPQQYIHHIEVQCDAFEHPCARFFLRDVGMIWPPTHQQGNLIYDADVFSVAS